MSVAYLLVLGRTSPNKTQVPAELSVNGQSASAELAALTSRLKTLRKPTSLNSLAAHLGQTQSFTTPRKSTHQSKAAIEDDYTKNLQQQVYLLELETRYLREKKGHDFGEAGLPEQVEQSSMPLRDTFRTLKLKYVEMQSQFQQEMKSLEDQLKSSHSDIKHHELTIEHMQMEKYDFSKEIKHLRDLRVGQSELVHKEFLALRQEHLLLQAEKQHFEASYQRSSKHSNELQDELNKSKAEHSTSQAEHISLTSNTATLEESLKQSLLTQKTLASELELSTSTRLSSSLQLIQTQHDQLIKDHIQLQQEFTTLTSRHEASQSHNKKLELNVEELTHEQALYTVSLNDKNRELKRMNEIVDKVRADEERRIKARSASVRDRDEEIIEELITEEVENEMQHIKTSGDKVVSSGRDAQIKNLNKELLKIAEVVTILTEDKNNLLDQVQALQATIRLQEERRVITEEERNALQASLTAAEQKYDDVMSKLKQLLIENENIQTSLESANRECLRLQQVEKIAVQMRGWKDMMEENAKMASEMQALVQKFTTTSVGVVEVNTKPKVAIGPEHALQNLLDTRKNSTSIAMASVMDA